MSLFIKYCGHHKIIIKKKPTFANKNKSGKNKHIYIKNCRRRKIPMKKSRIVRIKKNSSEHEYNSSKCSNNSNYYKFRVNLKNVYFKNTATNSKLDLKLQNWS